LGAEPRIIHTADSVISGKINVWDHQGSLVLEVGGYPQSISLNTPNLKERYWFRAVEEVGGRLVAPRRVLVIGVGGGTILHLFSWKFPGVAITGVEIDPEIVRVARDFFELDRVPNLTLVLADGKDFVANYQGERFDLSFVDAYLGGNFPLAFEEEVFLRRLQRITRASGLIAINRAGGGGNLTSFRQILARIFAKVEMIKIPLPGFLGEMTGNYLFICQ